MSFDLEQLRIKLSQYGTVLNCALYEDDTVLEIKVKNNTGKSVTYTNIETTMIMPWFPTTIKSYFGEGYYKSSFSK